MVRCGTSPVNQWLSRRPAAASVLLGQAIVETRPAGEGRGLGLFAIGPVQAFSQILSDPPLILMRPKEDLPELYQHFLHLAKDRQREFLTLSASTNDERDAFLRSKIIQRGLDSTYDDHALTEMIRVANATQRNAFNVDMRDGRGPHHRAVFPIVARINHSCAPNAHACFYPPSERDGPGGRMTLHALRDLEAGEEILISYFTLLMSHSDRQQKATKWGFECRCPICTYEVPEVDGEELRCMFLNFNHSMSEIKRSTRITISEIHSNLRFGQMLEKAALAQSSMYPALPELYDAMGLLQGRHATMRGEQDSHGIVPHMEKSALWEARITGTESPATKDRLAKLTQFVLASGSKQSAVTITNTNNEYTIRWQDISES